jgi:hypothetical protein
LTSRAPKSAPAFINGLFTNFDRAALRLKEAFTSRPHCPPQQEDANMLRSLSRLSIAAVLLAALNGSATATPNCLKDQQAYALTDDVVQWTMTIVPGAECIQGLRWSYMQIEQVAVLTAPKNGKAVIVGPGFRYFADPGFQGSDTFTVAVSGKNRKTPGKSVLQIEVTARSKELQLVSTLVK